MARMMGKDPAYARPMDAGDEVRGPLVRIMYCVFVSVDFIQQQRYRFTISSPPHLNRYRLTAKI